MKLRPKNWRTFQHYQDAKGSPSWVKLHKKLLDDYEFASTPLASKALAPLLWLIASEHPDGVIDADPQKLAFRLRWPVSDITDGLSPLIGKGFFEVVQFPSAESRESLEPSYSASSTEDIKQRIYTREETPLVPLKRDGGRLKSKSENRQRAVELLEFLNGRAGKHFRPVPANLKFIEARLAEGVTVQDLKTLTVRKCREWLGTDQEKYLRPETLFNATKCQSYLGEIPPEGPCNAPSVIDRSSPAQAPAPADGDSPPPKSAQASSPSEIPIADAAPGLAGGGASFQVH